MAQLTDQSIAAAAVLYTPEMLEIQGEVHHRLLRETDFTTLENYTQEQLAEQVRRFANVVLTNHEMTLPVRTLDQLTQAVISEIRGFGPLEVLLADDSISEIMVNGPGHVVIERSGKLLEAPIRFADGEHIMRIIEKIIAPLGRRLDEAVPMVDARLPDGSRVNAIIPPLAVKGPYLTIRKFSADPLMGSDLVRFGSMSAQMCDFLELCVRGKLNVIVSGGTGSGKTTTLNVLSSFIPVGERIVTIEDAAELQLQQEHVLTLESRPPNLEGTGEISIRDLVRNALRMRPDRIIVGEVRGGEALDMLQAMNTGHEGSLSTAHTNGPRDCLSRLETMVLMAGTELPSHAIRQQISSAIDLIVHQDRMRDGSRKITYVTEVQRMEGDEIITQDLFTLKHHGVDDDGRLIVEHRPMGIQPLFVDKLAAEGVQLPPNMFLADAEPTQQRRSFFG
ncbi:MAG: CpaF family protein [candidate division WS1 bacterium]|jgi:pilus assembly protein CpaF|nr:CpaF family protein [candidate division WS1 bacterium]